MTVLEIGSMTSTVAVSGWMTSYGSLGLRTGESISVGLSPFAPRKPRSFAERKATLISASVLSVD